MADASAYTQTKAISTAFRILWPKKMWFHLVHFKWKMACCSCATKPIDLLNGKSLAFLFCVCVHEIETLISVAISISKCEKETAAAAAASPTPILKRCERKREQEKEKSKENMETKNHSRAIVKGFLR